MPKYFELKTLYHNFGKDFAARDGGNAPTPRQFYNMFLDSLKKDNRLNDPKSQLTIEYNRSVTEQQWHVNGCPYYKVDNDAINLFRTISLDVPFKYVVLPFDTFSLHFAEDNPLIAADNRRIQSMMVCQGLDTGKNKFFDLWCDCGEKDTVALGDKRDFPVLNYVHMRAEDDKIIQDSLDKMKKMGGSSDLSIANIEGDILRIAIAVCFLATSMDKMIRPDILSKDMPAYLEAKRKNDKARITTIEERAKRRGKCGFIVDGARELVHTQHDHEDHNGKGHSLKYRHMRSAHFRYIKKTQKVTFVRMTAVRPDLPAPPK